MLARCLPVKSTMAKKPPSIHVVPQDGRWAVKSAGASRAASLHDTQRAALDAARPSARARGAELVIHGRDGRIRDSDSYGNDPCPPRDAKH